MKGYYKERLASSRLRQVYELCTPRIRQYLKAELDYALTHLNQDDLVLDLGCGYGRQFPDLCNKAGFVVGIDSSAESLALGNAYLKEISNYLLIEMSARKLLFPDESFDVVLCLQNGISAFHVEKHKLVREAIRVTKRGGRVLFTSYSEKIWEERLKWFQRQSEAGLLGPIDDEKTQNGNIVCTDGFTSTTINEEMFQELIKGIPEISATITEVDDSCIFLTIKR